MPQHRRLTRPGSVHAVGYWQDTDPTLDGPVAEGTYWHDTTLLLTEGEVIVRMYEGEEWVVAPGGGTVKSFAIPLGNGSIAVGSGIVMQFALPGMGTLIGWRVMDPFESPTNLELDLWIDDAGVPTIADSVVGTTPPTLAAAQDSEFQLVDPDDWTADWGANSTCIAVVTTSAGCTGGTLQVFYVRR